MEKREVNETVKMLRRGSYMGGEPLIVVEESGGIQEEDESELSDNNQDSPSIPDSPLLNPYLLSPYRDLRKRSLPTPSCTSGITASQVRRLSEQGGETGKGPSPMEAAFLATLSSAPAPTAGGRRHSVVTISRAPPTSILFGRNRRESIAAFPSSGLPLGRFPRKDSSSSLARSPSISGSNFNLQLDIMDDIAEIKAARKVRLKMWQTENQEKVCEVQPIEGGSAARYHQKENRRFSDLTGIAPIQAQTKRRASELPKSQGNSSTPPSLSKASGIVCSNNDLMTIVSSLTSSAQEINTPQQAPVPETPPPKPSALDDKRSRLKNNRSNSFDISLLPDKKNIEPKEKETGPGNWFLRRHLPMANKKYIGKSEDAPPAKEVKKLTEKSGRRSLDDKVVWDKPSGSVVDPQLIGSAIEVFLTQRTGDSPQSETPTKKVAGQKSSWLGTETKETDEEVSCDNSICSTLKDLFVK
ncbi:uncharacterized protein isoform X1 [Rhodnius prolixus]|uniref:uncharacterized protein isoform X1 n=1 Tax=Rhodnius prolixus TaxID=13249 RepID=UPI003D18CCC6